MLSNILQMCAACQTCGWTVSVGRALSENEFNATHVTSLCRKGILTDLLPPADQSLAQPTVNTALSTSSKRFPFVSNLRAINHCRDGFQQEKVCITQLLDVWPFSTSLRP